MKILTKSVIFSILLSFVFVIDIYSQVLDFEWVKRTEGLSSEIGNCITVDLNGDIYSTGSFQGTVDFDPGTSVLNYTAIGVNDFLYKN